VPGNRRLLVGIFTGLAGLAGLTAFISRGADLPSVIPCGIEVALGETVRVAGCVTGIGTVAGCVTVAGTGIGTVGVAIILTNQAEHIQGRNPYAEYGSCDID
jgi:hypothetical protein